MIELTVRRVNEYCYLTVKASSKHMLMYSRTDYLNNLDAIKTLRNIIKTGIKLLPDECKGEIELLEAVHRKLDSKGEL